MDVDVDGFWCQWMFDVRGGTIWFLFPRLSSTNLNSGCQPGLDCCEKFCQSRCWQCDKLVCCFCIQTISWTEIGGRGLKLKTLQELLMLPSVGVRTPLLLFPGLSLPMLVMSPRTNLLTTSVCRHQIPIGPILWPQSNQMYHMSQRPQVSRIALWRCSLNVFIFVMCHCHRLFWSGHVSWSHWTNVSKVTSL